MQECNRRTFMAAAGLVAAGICGPAAAFRAPCRHRLLFVCRFGTVKSPIAREHLRRRAAARSLPVEVRARGITPQEHMSPQLRMSLAADGIDPAAEPIRALSPVDLQWADTVIYFDDLPARSGLRDARDWRAVPSMLQDYAAARAELTGRIDRLLDELEKGRRCRPGA